MNKRNTIPAWALRDDPLFATLTGSKMHRNCDCADCKPTCPKCGMSLRRGSCSRTRCSK